MQTLEAVRDFTEFYLLPYQPLKNVELVQYKINRKIKGTEDPLLLTVSAFKESIKLLKRFRKSSLVHTSHAQPPPETRLYYELTHFTPEDCLIMLSKDRYELSDSTLALIFQKSELSVQFRRNQLARYLSSEKISFNHSKDLTPIPQQEPEFRAVQIHKSIFQRFKALPFLIRFSLETGLVLSTLVLLMWIIPEIRNTYENSVQKRINDYLIESSLIDSPAPVGTSKTPKTPIPEAEVKDEVEANEPAETTTAVRKQPKVNDGETWRFSFTGSQTTEIETGVQDTLKKLHVETTKPLTVPGGLQFDLLVPTQTLIRLKESFEDMTNEMQRKAGLAKQPGVSSSGVNLSWYKKRNMGTRKIPSAHVQVIIWISTL